MVDQAALELPIVPNECALHIVLGKIYYKGLNFGYFRAKVANVLSWVAIIAVLIETRVLTAILTIPR